MKNDILKKTASSGTFELNMVSEQCAGVGEKTEDEERTDEDRMAYSRQ